MIGEPLPEKATVLVAAADLASQHWLEAVAKAAGYRAQAIVTIDGFIVVRYGRLPEPSQASALSSFEQANLDL